MGGVRPLSVTFTVMTSEKTGGSCGTCGSQKNEKPSVRKIARDGTNHSISTCQPQPVATRIPIAATLMVDYKMPWVPVVGLSLLLGAAIGAAQGYFVAFAKIPSFIVPLFSE